MKTKHIIMFRSPKLKGRARQYGFGYSKIAHVEFDPSQLDDGESEPKMISERCKSVVKIHDCRQLYMGKGIKSEGARFVAQLEDKINKINR